MSMPDFDATTLKGAPEAALPQAPRTSRTTRISRAWGWISFGLAALVVVVVFALQNLSTVEVSFLSLHGELPLAVLLLVVAALGALIVFAFGAARIMQLRLHARRASPELSVHGSCLEPQGAPRIGR